MNKLIASVPFTSSRDDRFNIFVVIIIIIITRYNKGEEKLYLPLWKEEEEPS